MDPKPNVIFVLGGPGAGKGTICSSITTNWKFTHLSAGDLLRAECANPQSVYGNLIQEHIRNGTIVPVEITCSLIEEAIVHSVNNKGTANFLIDGFPRNQDNLSGWNRQMSHKVNVPYVLFLDCDEETCVQRCLKRGESAAGDCRTDDNIDSVRKRIVTYRNDTLPIVNYFQSVNLVRKVDGSKNPEEVFDQVQELFREYESRL